MVVGAEHCPDAGVNV
jgi:hypothetical protein